MSVWLACDRFVRYSSVPWFLDCGYREKLDYWTSKSREFDCPDVESVRISSIRISKQESIYVDMIRYPDKKVQKSSNLYIESSGYQNMPFDASISGNPEIRKPGYQCSCSHLCPVLLESILRPGLSWLHLNTLGCQKILGELVTVDNPVTVAVDKNISSLVQIPEGDKRLWTDSGRGPGGSML